MKWELLLLGIFLIVQVSFANEDLKLSSSQKKKLDKLKNAVGSKLDGWMKDGMELILVRYLREKDWDVLLARNAVMDTIKWRNDFGIARKENWGAEWEREYPCYTDGVDRDGQPVMAFDFGEWDVRKATLQGKIQDLVRWWLKKREETVQKSWDYQKAGKTNGTQWHFIMNLEKFTQTTHLCSACLQLYTQFALVYQQHYPGSAETIMMINTPSTFQTVLTLVKPVLSDATNKSIQPLGPKSQWAPILHKRIDPSQLPESVGGTKVYH